MTKQWWSAIWELFLSTLESQPRVQMGYQPKRPPKPEVTLKEIQQWVLYELECPGNYIMRQCTRCRKFYMILLPPGVSESRDDGIWQCHKCPIGNDGPYR